MIKRTIEISQRSVHLTVRNEQLLLLDHASDDVEVGSAPCEDVGMVVVDQPGVTYSHAALAKLVEYDAAVVVCDRRHMPAGVLLPMTNHSQVVWRIQDQLSCSKPLRKRLWQRIVIAKVRAQAQNLPAGSPTHRKLLTLARSVRSGDPTNVEAQAARAYWSALFNDRHFRRDTDGDGINALLNYGYAVCRAALARCLVGAGLLPAIGLHHSNRSNAFCLADDLLEPIRPLVDARVRHAVEHGPPELSPDTKRQLLALLGDPVLSDGQSGPLLVALHRYVASLTRCYATESRELVIPVAVSEAPRSRAPSRQNTMTTPEQLC